MSSKVCRRSLLSAEFCEETRALTFNLMNEVQPNLAFFYFSEALRLFGSRLNSMFRRPRRRARARNAPGPSLQPLALAVRGAKDGNGKSRRPPPCPHPGIHCGYGGGLTSENLTSELRSIAKAGFHRRFEPISVLFSAF